MTYLEDLLRNWRPIVAATIGMGSGIALGGTITSALAPHMIAGNGWDKADFALVGSLGLISAAAFPFVGRLVDVAGVRLTALIGQISLPLVYLAYSMMSGSLAGFVAIFIVQSLLCVTTTATVYTPLLMQNITLARGMALAIVASGPAVVGAIGGPVLNAYVEANGWRASYQALAAFSIVAGIVTFLLIPPERKATATRKAAPQKSGADYPAILKSPAFWILAVAMLLCNLPQVIMLTQLKVLLLDNGVSGSGAGVMIGALSLGMLTGRFLTGLALDRFNPYLVSFVTLGLPSMGLFVLASSFDAPLVLTGAVFFLGFAFGAESDIVAYIIGRCFDGKVYGSVMGLIAAVVMVSSALGAVLLSLVLEHTGGFELFLVLSGCAVLTGAALLLRLNALEKALPGERGAAGRLAADL